MNKVNVIVIGNSQSGKSSLIQRYTMNKFQEIYTPTIAIDFDSRVYPSGFKVQIWDTSGNDVKSMRIWSKSADIAICIYCSVGSTMEWIHELRQHCLENVLIALVVTKKDLIYPRVFNKSAHQLAKQLNCLYFEVSALTGENVDYLFEACIENKLQQTKETIVDSPSKSLLEPVQIKDKCCCLF